MRVCNCVADNARVGGRGGAKEILLNMPTLASRTAPSVSEILLFKAILANIVIAVRHSHRRISGAGFIALTTLKTYSSLLAILAIQEGHMASLSTLCIQKLHRESAPCAVSERRRVRTCAWINAQHFPTQAVATFPQTRATLWLEPKSGAGNRFRRPEY